MVEQILLAPSDKRRDQQIGKVEIVQWLRGETQPGHQVLDRQWRTEPQPVHPCHRHPSCVETRDNQPGKVSTFAYQYHDVARPRIAVGTFLKRETLIQPLLDLSCDFVGQPPFGTGKPGFLSLFAT